MELNPKFARNAKDFLRYYENLIELEDNNNKQIVCGILNLEGQHYYFKIKYYYENKKIGFSITGNEKEYQDNEIKRI